MQEEKGFELVSAYQPTGDQPQAIQQLAEGVLHGDKEQTLLGVTVRVKLLPWPILSKK